MWKRLWFNSIESLCVAYKPKFNILKISILNLWAGVLANVKAYMCVGCKRTATWHVIECWAFVLLAGVWLAAVSRHHTAHLLSCSTRTGVICCTGNTWSHIIPAQHQRHRRHSTAIVSSLLHSRFMIHFNTSCLGVILQVRGRDGMSIHRRMVRLHTHSLTYHVFARLVSRCRPCSFRLPECPSPMVGPS